MAVQRESQIPDLSESSDVAAESRRESQPAKLRLVQPDTPAQGVPFVAVKGEAPGCYTPGPAILARGARVGILCDTLHGDREIDLDYHAGLRAGTELIAALGFEPVIDREHAAVAPYFQRWAGSVPQRLEHFMRLCDDLRVDAIFPLFGKGGCHAVVDALAETDYRPRRPIVLIGGFSQHSDWSLFAQSTRGRGFFSHVINATQCAYWKVLPRANVDNLAAVLQGADSVHYTGLRALNVASFDRPLSGLLSGGNLSAILLNAQKSWLPDFRGRVVLCEDYDRHAHDFHRTFSAFARVCERAGAAAILVAAMLPIKRAAHAALDPDRRRQEAEKDRAEIASIVDEVASRTHVPVFSHAGICGHGLMNYPLGFGGLTRIVPQSDGSATLFNQLKVWS